MINFKKYPIVKQTGLKNCGPACLLAIIKFYKGNLSLEYLTNEMNVTKNGTTAYHLIKTAKNIGFQANGIKLSFNDLKPNNIILPCIAHVIIDKAYYHFIVIYKINFKTKKMLILDPASGIKTMSFNAFNTIWDNILIELYPIKNIPRITTPSLKDFISKFFINNKKVIINIVFISLLLCILTTLSSFYIQSLLHTISNHYSLLIFFTFLNIHVIRNLADFFKNKLLIFLNLKLSLYLTTDTFNKILNLPYRYYRNKTTGEIISRIHDMDNITDSLGNIILLFFVELPLSIIALIIMSILNTTLTFYTCLFIIAYTTIFFITNTPLKKRLNNCLIEKENYLSYMTECITGFETIKGLNLEKESLKKLDRKYILYLKYLYRYQTLLNITLFFKDILYDITFLIIGLIGINMIINSSINLGLFLTFQNLTLYFLTPIKNIMDEIETIKLANTSLKRVFELYDVKEEKGIYDNLFKLPIVLKNLSYDEKDSTILHNINLKINNQDKIIIYGSSGSGKSTLVKIIKKYLDINRDMVKINDIDINDLKTKNIKENIVYISQQEILFNTSLYHNITLDEQIDSNNFNQISKICFLNDIIKDKPLGYNTLIEENGFNLSGGERQRIVLARSLLRKFSILIIDEGLSQTDTALERKILKNVLHKFHDKTIIFISHRLDNQDLFKRKIQIENGVLSEKEL